MFGDSSSPEQREICLKDSQLKLSQQGSTSSEEPGPSSLALTGTQALQHDDLNEYLVDQTSQGNHWQQRCLRRQQS